MGKYAIFSRVLAKIIEFFVSVNFKSSLSKLVHLSVKLSSLSLFNKILMNLSVLQGSSG